MLRAERMVALTLALALATARTAAAATMYRVTDVGSLGGGDSVPTSINAAGQVVGMSATLAPSAVNMGLACGSWSGLSAHVEVHAFVYSGSAGGSTLTDVGPSAAPYSWAADIGPDGEAVGGAGTYIGPSTGFLYRAGTITDLGTFIPHAVGPGGLLVGGDTANSVAATYNAGTVTSLGTLGGSGSSAIAVNAAGQIVGASGTASGGTHAFLFDTGVMSDLLLPNSPNFAMGIDDAGRIVAQDNDATYVLDHGSVTAVPLYTTWPHPLNNHGVIVGGANFGGIVRAVRFAGGVLTDLTTVVSHAPGMLLISAVAVNDAGQIAVCAQANDYHLHALRLDPFDPALCGNGALDAGEECDDGNTADGDGCDSNCTYTTCGNGRRSGTEECDDGNKVDGDGCDADCTTTRCGNGRRTLGEQCDDGNNVDGDGCSATCRIEAPGGCGDGIVDPGEECDDANMVSGDGCDADCTATRCGNGVLTAGEDCDDGNALDGDGCSAACALETPAACGNGVVDPGETCDDGNAAGDDGCSATCQLETYPDIRGPWQLTTTYGGGSLGVLATTGSFITVVDEESSTGLFKVREGFSCGTTALLGQLIQNSSCTLAPRFVIGALRGANGATMTLPARGAYTAWTASATLVDVVGCTPLHSTEAVLSATGVATSSSGQVARVDGTLVNHATVFSSAPGNCGTYALTAAFVMRRNNVPVGTAVGVQPRDGSTVRFDTVSAAGEAGVVTVTSPTAALPTNFTLSDGLTYADVLTDAGIAGTITTCLPYADANDDGFVDGTSPPMPEGQLQILHAENGAFVDRTTSRDPVHNVICAATSSLSEFAVGVPGPTTTTTTTLPSVAPCPQQPEGGCAPAVAKKSKLKLRKPGAPTGTKLAWKWTGAAAVAHGDFGDPSAIEVSGLCIYANGSLVSPMLVLPGGTCGKQPCWRSSPTTFTYKNAGATPQGITAAKLVAGAAGHAKILVKGGGALLPPPPLPFAAPIEVQWRTADGACWSARYDTTKNDTALKLDAVSD
jgi:cysteine-rich repeat protein/probable HAF family extracellular repeat protein